MVVILEKSTNKVAYLSVIGGIVFVLLLLIAYLGWKIRKEKQFRKELAAAGLLYFKEGVTKSLNPDMGIDEQAELLPYDERFEFPSEKLVLGMLYPYYYYVFNPLSILLWRIYGNMNRFFWQRCIKILDF